MAWVTTVSRRPVVVLADSGRQIFCSGARSRTTREAPGRYLGGGRDTSAVRAALVSARSGMLVVARIGTIGSIPIPIRATATCGPPDPLILTLLIAVHARGSRVHW